MIQSGNKKVYSGIIKDVQAICGSDGILSKILESAIDTSSEWENTLDERQVKEVMFSLVYHDDFHHGTAGHNQYMLIAELAQKLDVYEMVLHRLIEYLESGITG